MKLTQLLQEQDDAFPPLFHGTSSDNLAKTGNFTSEPIYLATEEEDAVGYAQGMHMGGAGGRTKYVMTISANEGKILNANNDVDLIMAEQHKHYDDLDDLINDAKRQGYRYIFFMHPAIGADEETETFVSLYPHQDLQVIGVDKV